VRARHGSAPTELVTQNLIWIVLAFMLVGPPIGGLTFWLVGSISAAFSPDYTLGAGPFARVTADQAVSIFLLTIVGSYLLGAAPAAIAGATLGFVQIHYGRTPWYAALACGVVVGAGYAGYLFIVSSHAGGNPPARMYEGAVAVLICVVPTLVCWALMRRCCARRASTAAAAPSS
jgi:hypothetical protein